MKIEDLLQRVVDEGASDGFVVDNFGCIVFSCKNFTCSNVSMILEIRVFAFINCIKAF